MRTPARVTGVLAAWYTYIAEEYLERGSIVHEVCRYYVADREMFLFDEKISGYGQSFKLWYDEYVEFALLSEQRYVDSILVFTGKIDLLFRFKGDKHNTLGDYKTGTPHKSWPIQLAAYRYLLEKAGHRVKRCGNLVLFASGACARWIDQPKAMSGEAMAIFLSALNCYNYFNEGKGEDYEDG